LLLDQTSKDKKKITNRTKLGFGTRSLLLYPKIKQNTTATKSQGELIRRILGEGKATKRNFCEWKVAISVSKYLISS
jgi:hypothetical protein